LSKVIVLRRCSLLAPPPPDDLPLLVNSHLDLAELVDAVVGRAHTTEGYNTVGLGCEYVTRRGEASRKMDC
jgi:hypothetical protein